MKKALVPSVPVIPAIFSFEFLYENVHNSTCVPSCIVNGIAYEAVANNSFIKLRTFRGTEYLVARLQKGDHAPDWKLHFAIQDEDIPRAWNLLASLFLELQIESVMKVKMHSKEEWPEHMNGREITIYIPMEERGETNINDRLWIKFIKTAALQLAKINIKAKKIAEGDFALGAYCSIRNEAFIPVKTGACIPKDWQGYDFDLHQRHPDTIQYIYPPNAYGCNAAKHPTPKFFQKFERARSNKALLKKPFAP